jgi:O-antigen/teichoic acid export membrane protein
VVDAIRKKLGLDGAVAFTFLARSVSIVGSTGTVLLIVRFLSPVEQGYYYTLLSLVSLQMVFELGFSFVIQQLAAHECTRLELQPNGTVSGDPLAHARLASTLQLSLRWYTVAAAAMAVILAPMGFVFFAHQSGAASPVLWHGPWFAAVFASAFSLWCMPFYSFMEGCGHVRSVAALRFRQAVAASVLAWAGMLLHHGLYSPALVIAGQIGTGLIFLFKHRRFLMGLLRHPAGQSTIQWSREVWPFQWRIAISWMCSYFTVQMFTPILFAQRGAVEAGQMGMSLSITGYLTGLALTWSSTKITLFGRLVARREFRDLDRLFLRTLGQALTVFGIMAVSALGVAKLLPWFAPRLAARILPPPLFAVLIVGAAGTCIVQSLATLLRSFKSEPFLVQSLVVASITLVLGAATARRWGSAGAAFSYLTASAGIGLPIAIFIFVRARRAYLHLGPIVPCESEAG